MAELSNAEIDRLGERLRNGSPTEGDLRLLDEYKGSFQQTFEITVDVLHERKLHPTKRASKSNISIIAKLRRQPKLRLSRMQDIAGCRIIVNDIADQDRLMELLKKDFSDVVIKDRRKEPSHGYRAVHVIAKVAGKSIEIQIRSLLQQFWAEISERASDTIDPEVKYGGGPAEFQRLLRVVSDYIGRYEVNEGPFMEADRSRNTLNPSDRAMHDKQQEDLSQLHDMILKHLYEFTALCDQWKKGKK